MQQETGEPITSGGATRNQIVAAADRLFYEQGFERTSFADIATAVGISRGNFYYHFKTKDEILDAVIGMRLAGTEAMLRRWEADDRPRERIRSFVHILVANRAEIERFGCPIGTLCGELAKLGHAARDDAKRLFELFRTWLAREFVRLGCAEPDDLALHVLAFSQGVATLSNTFRDEAFVRREVALMDAWIDAQPPMPA